MQSIKIRRNKKKKRNWFFLTLSIKYSFCFSQSQTHSNTHTIVVDAMDVCIITEEIAQCPLFSIQSTSSKRKTNKTTLTLINIFTSLSTQSHSIHLYFVVWETLIWAQNTYTQLCLWQRRNSSKKIKNLYRKILNYLTLFMWRDRTCFNRDEFLFLIFFIRTEMKMFNFKMQWSCAFFFLFMDGMRK